MTTSLADDYTAIKARMEELAKERAEPRGAETGGVEKEIQHGAYMGWDIYAPHTVTQANG